ncbi:MAG: glycosyl transferase family 1 [Gemmatimonadetes bacterium]|nr:glycosyl transferase family 1 [Gemmatimonadota bacterium]
MKPYVIVAGDFVTTGGMDAANHALAMGLAQRGREVHVVAHRAADDLLARPEVTFHRVPRPMRSHRLGMPLLDHVGRRLARAIARRGAHVVANGGSCAAGDVVWLHYVHAAYPADDSGLRTLLPLGPRRFRADELRAVRRARLVIANSARTADDAVRLLGARPERVRTAYYGADADRFRPPSPEERAAARAALGWDDDRPALAFVGALGDRRKGFDTLFSAFAELCRDASWDARLAVAGTGAELPAWRARAADAGLADRIHFLGFQLDVRRLLWAADAFVAPTRYEAYGLAVQEALCCALPAIVSAAAGVAERIPRSLADLLVRDPDDATELADVLRAWDRQRGAYASAARDASAALRRRTWSDMAAEMMAAIEGDG